MCPPVPYPPINPCGRWLRERGDTPLVSERDRLKICRIFGRSGKANSRFDLRKPRILSRGIGSGTRQRGLHGLSLVKIRALGALFDDFAPNITDVSRKTTRKHISRGLEPRT